MPSALPAAIAVAMSNCWRVSRAAAVGAMASVAMVACAPLDRPVSAPSDQAAVALSVVAARTSVPSRSLAAAAAAVQNLLLAAQALATARTAAGLPIRRAISV